MVYASSVVRVRRVTNERDYKMMLKILYTGSFMRHILIDESIPSESPYGSLRLIEPDQACCGATSAKGQPREWANPMLV